MRGKGEANLGYLKKRGAQLQAASGGALEDNVLKICLCPPRRDEVFTAH